MVCEVVVWQLQLLQAELVRVAAPARLSWFSLPVAVLVCVFWAMVFAVGGELKQVLMQVPVCQARLPFRFFLVPGMAWSSV